MEQWNQLDPVNTVNTSSALNKFVHILQSNVKLFSDSYFFIFIWAIAGRKGSRNRRIFNIQNIFHRHFDWRPAKNGVNFIAKSLLNWRKFD